MTMFKPREQVQTLAELDDSLDPFDELESYSQLAPKKKEHGG